MLPLTSIDSMIADRFAGCGVRSVGRARATTAIATAPMKMPADTARRRRARRSAAATISSAGNIMEWGTRRRSIQT